MRKIQLIGVAIIAMFAFSAMVVTSAFAAGELLVAGAKVTQTLALAVTPAAGTTLLLEDMGAPGKPDVLCAGILDGNVVPGGTLVLVDKILTSGGVDEGNMVDCTDDNNVCSSPVLVTAVNLPWDIDIELVGTGWVGRLLGTPGYEVDCNTILGLVSDTCTGETTAPLANEAGGLLAEFSETEAVTPPGSCSLGGAKQGLLAGDGFVTLVGGGALTVSE